MNSLLPSITDMEVAKTDASFLKARAGLQIVVFLITVVTYAVGVFFFQSSIADDSTGGRCLFFSLLCMVPPVFPEPPFLIFSVFLALLRRFRHIGPRWSGVLLFGQLCLFGPGLLGTRLLCSCSLSLYH